MNVQKFYGSNSRDAMQQVRDALGGDALILSNRKVADGVEITAVAGDEMDALTYPKPAVSPTAGKVTAASAFGSEAIAAILNHKDAASTPPPSLKKTIAAATEALEKEPRKKSRSTIAQEAPPPRMPRWEVQPDPQEDIEQVPELSSTMAGMAFELKHLRSLLEGQLSGFAWGELARRDPIKAELLRVLFGAGFSPALSRKLVDALPDGMDFEKGVMWLKKAIAHNLRVDESGADVIERGGIVALVGPTGVGKTTTVAKLAAHAVLRFGASNIALLSTDSYRIGAHEQLRIYGRILNVPVFAVKEDAELDSTLAELQRSHLVLIDTVGMSQRDRNIPEQIKFLCGDNRQVKRQLILPATAQGVTLDDIVRAHQGVGLDGCILTKVDESVSLAPAIDCLIRHGLKLHYVTNGQRVPEDIRTANSTYLVDRAFKGQSTGAMQISQDEMVMQGDWAGTGDLFG
ncbi:MAG: flagellar biosynthesis protein FlhF [Methylophilales bacterium]|nr:flagellar biosynthesis protein FlhF [Methylophilales bacterium]